jgi:hypothetical protein
MLTVLGGLAELERDLIRSRTGEAARKRARYQSDAAAKAGLAPESGGRAPLATGEGLVDMALTDIVTYSSISSPAL